MDTSLMIQSRVGFVFDKGSRYSRLYRFPPERYPQSPADGPARELYRSSARRGS